MQEIIQSTIQALKESLPADAQVTQQDATTHLLLRDNQKHIDITDAIERAQTSANRKKNTQQLTEIDSFIQYIKDQNCQNEGYIYADPENRTLTAVFNDFASDTPGWRDHRAVFTAALSREFSKWMSNDRKPMSQEDFAIFLEDNIADIAEPSGDTMLSVALTLEAKTSANFASSKRLDNGQIQFAYVENIDTRAGSGLIEVPREFAIGVRLFKNGDGYRIRARLKYRLTSGNIKFWYELDRPENALEDAFSEYIAKVQAMEYGYKLLYGRA